MYFKIKLAGRVFGITCQFEEVYAYCRDYVVKDSSDWHFREDAADIEIVITAEDILREKSIETLVVLRKIADIMPAYQCFLMHGTVVSWRGNGYMFTAPSGTGKSTHAALWKKYLENDVEIINGDKPFIRVENSGRAQKSADTQVYAYGSPWAGKEHWQKNTRVPLKGLCFLQRGKTNTIRKIQPTEAMPMLMPQVYCTNQPTMAAKVLDMLDVVFDEVPMYVLTCDMSEEAVRCSFEGMVDMELRRKNDGV